MSRVLRCAVSLTATGVLLALSPLTPAANAHGGSHPTPFPSPTPPPSWPTPTPFPTPGGPRPSDGPTTPWPPSTPSPAPPPGPSPTPTPGTGPRPTPGGPRPPSSPPPTGPTGPTAPSRPGRPRPASSGPDGLGWETWWSLNQWQYLRVRRVGVQASGGDEPGSPTGTGTVGNDNLWKFLLDQTNHKYYDIRAASCIAIGRAGHIGMAGFLQPKAHDPNNDVRESALLGMGMLGSPMPVIQMQMILRDPATPNRLRAAAALGLGFTNDQSAIPALRRLLEEDGEEEIRAAAALALGRAGGTPERDLLLKVAQNGGVDAKIRSYAIGALGRIARGLRVTGAVPDPTADVLRRLALGDRADEVRRASVLALGHIGDPDALDTVLKVWANDADNQTERFAILTAAQLASGRTEAIVVLNRLQPLLGGRGTAGERGFAAIAAGLLGHDKAGPSLLKMITSGGSQDSEAAACVGLGLLRYDKAHGTLAQVASGRGAPKVRGYAALALGMINHTEAATTLTMLLDTVTTPQIRGSAAVGLGLTGAPRGTLKLVKMLEGGDTYVRMTTAVALGFLRDETTLNPIMKRFEREQSNEVKALLVVALGRIAQRDELAPHQDLARGVNYVAPNAAIALAMRLQ